MFPQESTYQKIIKCHVINGTHNFVVFRDSKKVPNWRKYSKVQTTSVLFHIYFCLFGFITNHHEKYYAFCGWLSGVLSFQFGLRKVGLLGLILNIITFLFLCFCFFRNVMMEWFAMCLDFFERKDLLRWIFLSVEKKILKNYSKSWGLFLD